MIWLLGIRISPRHAGNRAAPRTVPGSEGVWSLREKDRLSEMHPRCVARVLEETGHVTKGQRPAAIPAWGAAPGLCKEEEER